MNYEPVIGFEIHVELATNSKMFCGCKNDPFGAATPNSHTCPVCLGLPGALPVANRKAIEYVMRVGLALGCEIPLFSKFDRKHYFYPDLPKGYQISQYDQPLCVGGRVAVPGGDVRIQRVHLEEDTGKLLHTTVHGKKVSLIDFNRSGVPLAEIVTEPDIKNGDHAKAFLKKVHQLIRYLDVSDADMEKGSMRLEPNISVRPVGQTELPSYKVEVKNINSFTFAKRAIEYEVNRQTAILQKGEIPHQENRGWNEEKNVTVLQRSKEAAEDYRYFPDPDLPPLRFTPRTIADVRASLPELPDAKRVRFMKDFGLTEVDAGQLTESMEMATFAEEAMTVAAKEHVTPKKVANWIINKKPTIEDTLPATLVKEIVMATTAVGMDESALTAVIDAVLRENPKAVTDYKAGKTASFMFLVGAVMRQTKGAVAATDVKHALEQKLK